ncbi:YdeI/OmpD-associated family protein [Cognatiyoonia sp. IB215446]|uniref:YdeI/OmpD-associated family protein n=1 Tax=Cognatiyoonia sp. IB215446 TaxID=3097355 RepID=UPI002A0CA770|nr:YdeI/OmpD-associated family protein [Cognatiyoonia sp. IB215446]MDX8348392.1 YdeI/OmpD-associated family protein [Cognatiyoonia sp. IB215446]
MTKTENFEKVTVTSTEELRDWLMAHYARTDSFWLVTYKKHMGDKYLDRFAVLDQLLCFGWIDGIRRVLDDDRTMQLISPRKTQHWAQSYKDRVARLEGEGLMHTSGRAAVAASKANGLWDFMNDVDALIVPKDLAAALNAVPPAKAHWEAFSPSSRRNMLRRIKLARSPATRAKRIAETATLAAQNQKVPQT